MGKRIVDESKVIETVSTYTRNVQNTEERSFGGLDQQGMHMEYKSSRVENPIETKVGMNTTNYNISPSLTVNDGRTQTS
jgi:hypothetical protein